MSFSLFLYATTPITPERAAGLIEFLSRVGLIHLSDTESGTFPSGPQTMHLITYLGCSPSLAAGENPSKVHIHLFPEITAMGGDSVETLRFPGCKHRIENAAELLSLPPHERYRCQQCGQQGRIEAINWRRSAGYSECFIEITSVFPKEALPSELLLDQLASYSAVTWDWFYSRTSLR
jgi:hypothetical protein